MREKAVKKDSISIDILPPRPNRALRSLLSVALSSRWAKTVYHNYSKNIINQIKIVLDMGYTSDVARNTRISKSTPLARKNIYYLLSIIYYLKSTGCANGFCSFAPQGYFFWLNPYGRDLCPPEKLPFKFFRAASRAARKENINIFRDTFQAPTVKHGCCTLSIPLFLRRCTLKKHARPCKSA